MPYKAKTEPLEHLELTTTQQVFDAYVALHGMGYRGSLTTVAGPGASIAMNMSDAVPVSVAVGDVIAYRVEPLSVVACMSLEAWIAGYEPI